MQLQVSLDHQHLQELRKQTNKQGKKKKKLAKKEKGEKMQTTNWEIIFTLSKPC